MIGGFLFSFDTGFIISNKYNFKKIVDKINKIRDIGGRIVISDIVRREIQSNFLSDLNKIRDNIEKCFGREHSVHCGIFFRR